MIRGIVGVIAGIVIGSFVILLIELLGHHVYPFPPGLDPKDHQALAKFMMTAPIGAWLFVLFAYAAGSFVAGASGTWIGRKPWIWWVNGAILMILGVLNLKMMPHPGWFIPVSLGIYLPCVWAGARLARPKVVKAG
ncbi:MAG TPA: hypothetical protein VNM14_20990 [Planctomycetota bacterium]|jgi:hypothetical protein|nr:hypothetical protein [Planctomycetota bacterium]